MYAWHWRRCPIVSLNIPLTVLVMTVFITVQAPWLVPTSMAAAANLAWRRLARPARPVTSSRTDHPVRAISSWEIGTVQNSIPKPGSIYERPAVLVIYRHDHRFLLDSLIRVREGSGPL